MVDAKKGYNFCEINHLFFSLLDVSPMLYQVTIAL